MYVMYGYLRNLLSMVTTRISHWTLRVINKVHIFAIAFNALGRVGMHYGDRL